jgi:hypothetical protein
MSFKFLISLVVIQWSVYPAFADQCRLIWTDSLRIYGPEQSQLQMQLQQELQSERLFQLDSYLKDGLNPTPYDSHYYSLRHQFYNSIDTDSRLYLDWYTSARNHFPVQHMNQLLREQRLSQMSAAQLLASQTLTGLISFRPVFLLPGTLLFRGVSYKPWFDQNIPEEGDVIPADQFVSTTTSPRVAWRFAFDQGHNGQAVVMVIELEDSLRAIPGMENEREFILSGKDLEFFVQKKMVYAKGTPSFHPLVDGVILHVIARRKMRD